MRIILAALNGRIRTPWAADALGLSDICMRLIYEYFPCVVDAYSEDYSRRVVDEMHKKNQISNIFVCHEKNTPTDTLNFNAADSFLDFILRNRFRKCVIVFCLDICFYRTC